MVSSRNFFFKCWHIVGGDVVKAIHFFFEQLELPRMVNAAAIALVPNQDAAYLMSQLRPIL